MTLIIFDTAFIKVRNRSGHFDPSASKRKEAALLALAFREHTHAQDILIDPDGESLPPLNLNISKLMPKCGCKTLYISIYGGNISMTIGHVQVQRI